MAFDREATKQRAAALAAKCVFIGTSSWKYEGWYGQLYTPARYEHRGKVAKTRFQRDCLSEYAEVFRPFAWTRRITIFRVASICKGWQIKCRTISDSASR